MHLGLGPSPIKLSWPAASFAQAAATESQSLRRRKVDRADPPVPDLLYRGEELDEAYVGEDTALFG